MADVVPARDWLTFSNSLLELLDEIENLDSENDAELHKLRLEQAISSLRLILPILPVDSESSQTVQQLLQNLHILLIGSDESHLDSRNCTALAVYNLEPPISQRTGSVGRPKLKISEETLLEFRSLGFTWKQIAGMLLVSRWTLYRRVRELNIEDLCGYSNLSDDELDHYRGSYLAGSSTHNQRIERLWRDVFCMVCNIFYYTFQAMEESGVLNISNVLHKFVLHFVFTPRINKALLSFVSAWNNHPIRTERNWSPTQIWSNGMIDMRNQNRNCTDDPANFSEDLEWYGYDGSAPRPSDDGLSTVAVEDLSHDFPDGVIEQLKNSVDPCQDSNDFGIDVYLRALDVMLALTGYQLQ